MVQRFFLHADTGVCDRELQVAVLRRGGNFDFSLLGKLRRVAQEIEQNLLKLIPVGF